MVAKKDLSFAPKISQKTLAQPGLSKSGLSMHTERFL